MMHIKQGKVWILCLINVCGQFHYYLDAEIEELTEQLKEKGLIIICIV